MWQAINVYGETMRGFSNRQECEKYIASNDLASFSQYVDNIDYNYYQLYNEENTCNYF